MPEGLWAAAAGRLGAAPASAGSGKGGRKCQRRVVPLAVNSAGHWGSTGGRGTALAEGNSAGSGRRHGPRTAQAIGAAPMGKAAPAAGNKACGAGLAHLRNFWYTGSRTHAAGGTGQSCALCRHTARGRALPLAPAARRACWRQCIGGAAARTRQRGERHSEAFGAKGAGVCQRAAFAGAGGAGAAAGACGAVLQRLRPGELQHPLGHYGARKLACHV